MKTPHKQKLARQRKRRRELARFRFPLKRAKIALPPPASASPPARVVSNPCITEEELFLACGLTAERIREVLETGAADPPPDPSSRQRAEDQLD